MLSCASLLFSEKHFKCDRFIGCVKGTSNDNRLRDFLAEGCQLYCIVGLPSREANRLFVSSSLASRLEELARIWQLVGPLQSFSDFENIFEMVKKFCTRWSLILLMLKKKHSFDFALLDREISTWNMQLCSINFTGDNSRLCICFASQVLTETLRKCWASMMSTSRRCENMTPAET